MDMPEVEDVKVRLAQRVKEYAKEEEKQGCCHAIKILKAARLAAAKTMEKARESSMPIVNAEIEEAQMHGAQQYVAKAKPNMIMKDQLLKLISAPRELTACGGLMDIVVNPDLMGNVFKYWGVCSPFAPVRKPEKTEAQGGKAKVIGKYERTGVMYQQIWIVCKQAKRAHDAYKVSGRWDELGIDFWRSYETNAILGIKMPLTKQEKAILIGQMRANEEVLRRFRCKSENRVGNNHPHGHFQAETGETASTQSRQDGGHCMRGVDYEDKYGETHTVAIIDSEMATLDTVAEKLSCWDMEKSAIISEHVTYIKPLSRNPEMQCVQQNLEPIYNKVDTICPLLMQPSLSSVAYGSMFADNMTITVREKTAVEEEVCADHCDGTNYVNSFKQPEASILLNVFELEPKPFWPQCGFRILEHLEDGRVITHHLMESCILLTLAQEFEHGSSSSRHTRQYGLSLYKSHKTQRSAMLQDQLNITPEQIAALGTPPPQFMRGGQSVYEAWRKKAKSRLAQWQVHAAKARAAYDAQEPAAWATPPPTIVAEDYDEMTDAVAGHAPLAEPSTSTSTRHSTSASTSTSTSASSSFAASAYAAALFATAVVASPAPAAGAAPAIAAALRAAAPATTADAAPATTAAAAAPAAAPAPATTAAAPAAPAAAPVPATTATAVAAAAPAAVAPAPVAPVDAIPLPPPAPYLGPDLGDVGSPHVITVSPNAESGYRHVFRHVYNRTKWTYDFRISQQDADQYGLERRQYNRWGRIFDTPYEAAWHLTKHKNSLMNLAAAVNPQP